MASIVTEVFYGKAVTYTAFSFFTLYLYDYALTLNDEMELFWTHGGSWVLQTAFITSRYLPAAGLLAGVLALNPSGLTLDDISCRGLMAGNIICQSTMSVCSTGLICLRILTIFQHNPRIKITLHISFWLGAISIFYFTGHALYYLLPKVVFAFDTCAIIVPPPPFTNIIIALAYMSGLPCEAVIIGATWYHAYATKDLRLSAWDSISWPILSRMYKDGMMFFVVGQYIVSCSYRRLSFIDLIGTSVYRLLESSSRRRKHQARRGFRSIGPHHCRCDSLLLLIETFHCQVNRG